MIAEFDFLRSSRPARSRDDVRQSLHGVPKVDDSNGLVPGISTGSCLRFAALSL